MHLTPHHTAARAQLVEHGTYVAVIVSRPNALAFINNWILRSLQGFGESGYIRLRRSATPVCGTDPTPEDGTGCAGAAPQHVCGQCGLLFDASYPTGAKLR